MHFRFVFNDHEIRRNSIDWLRNPGAAGLIESIKSEAKTQLNYHGQRWLQSLNRGRLSGKGSLFLNPRLTVVEFSWVLDPRLEIVEFTITRFRTPSQKELTRLFDTSVLAARA